MCERREDDSLHENPYICDCVCVYVCVFEPGALCCEVFECTQLPKCHSSNITIIKACAIYPKDHLVIFIKSIADNSLVMLASL